MGVRTGYCGSVLADLLKALPVLLLTTLPWVVSLGLAAVGLLLSSSELRLDESMAVRWRTSLIVEFFIDALLIQPLVESLLFASSACHSDASALTRARAHAELEAVMQRV